MKTLRYSSIIAVAVVALALLAASPVAMADIVQTLTYGPQSTNYGPVDMGTYNLFDSTSGILNSVTITFAGDINGTIQFTNKGSNATNVYGNDNGILTLTSGNSYIQSLFSSPLNVATGTAEDFGLAPGATGPIHNVTGSSSTAAIPVSFSEFSLFEASGGGTVDNLFDLSATGTSTVGSDNGNGTDSYTTNATGTITIDYNYSQNPPPGVPEPGTLSLFGTGLLGLAGMLRSRFSKSR
ncbi:MAG: choice-of-anchor E domain-containing protein [Terracidiphilus sp.]